ncbi:MAG TPA: AAA family ATPase, partial [Saprospiraceae bacterium]|nr:AAA family ATPase [Saprospiraceae bacterium]
MMGKLYKKMGLLTKGHVHEVDRVDLVGEYIGQTAPKVKEAIEKARGGVLFIDEAYSLARSEDDSKDFGREVLEILIKEMSNGIGNMVVIVAGYPKEMKYFLDSNPGLKSRFKLFFNFRDYMPEELMQIAEYACANKQVNLTPAATKALNQHIIDAYRDRDRTFGNARFVNDVIEKAKINLGLRVMDAENPKDLDKRALSSIILEDIQKVKFKRKRLVPNLPVDEPLLKTSLDELTKLRGMENVKKEIFELVKLVRYYKESGKDVLNKFFLHTVFVGNPGTGKTTVARILTRIYKALGLLERGHIVETDRQGLVAGFVGQTAIKTSEMIEKAYGGVLFIDEAYALTSNIGQASGDFGDEAIQTILKRMEDHRGEFYIFATGYPDNMEAFLKANPGLASRFDKILKFDDYDPDMLLEIAMDMFDQEKVKVAPKAKEYLKSYFEYIHERRDKYFGNARTVRNVVTEAIKMQNIRLANLPAGKRKTSGINKLLLVDVKSFALNNDSDVFQKKSMGFRK